MFADNKVASIAAFQALLKKAALDARKQQETGSGANDGFTTSVRKVSTENNERSYLSAAQETYEHVKHAHTRARRQIRRQTSESSTIDNSPRGKVPQASYEPTAALHRLQEQLGYAGGGGGNHGYSGGGGGWEDFCDDESELTDYYAEKGAGQFWRDSFFS